MNKGRLEAFSDGVFAIIITIMVLELKVPMGNSLKSLEPMAPIFLSYVISFIYVGIYWNNHHHTMQAVKSVNGGILWANMNLLFWLSLIPFGTAWMGENHFAQFPVTVYSILLIMNAVAYTILIVQLIKHHGKESVLAKAIGDDRKGKLSILIYGTAIAASWINTNISIGLFILVACIWFIPDKRIEKQIIK
jgi:uncharacterized membrane protein